MTPYVFRFSIKIILPVRVYDSFLTFHLSSCCFLTVEFFPDQGFRSIYEFEAKFVKHAYVIMSL